MRMRPQGAQNNKSEKSKSDAALKDDVLKAALKDAAFDGFTDSVLAKAGKSAGADKAALARLFPEGALSLIEFFSASVDEAMEKKLTALDLSKRKIRERIKLAVMTRLALLAPHKEAARRAAAMMSLPMHAGAGRQDDVPHGGCDVAGGRRHLHRFQFLYQARHPGRRLWLDRWCAGSTIPAKTKSATEAFLDARIENVMQFEKFKAKAKEALFELPRLRRLGNRSIAPASK